jgi:hypothetical protein
MSSINNKRRTLLKGIAQSSVILGSVGVARSSDIEPQSHLTYINVSETQGSPTDYMVNISDGTSFSGTLDGSSDSHSFPSDEKCTGAHAQGEGNIEIDFSGGFDSDPNDWVYVEGIDYFRDGTNPCMPYSFTIENILLPTCGLESSDEVHRPNNDDAYLIGEVNPGDIDGCETGGRFKSIHMDVKLADKIAVYRDSSWQC